MRAEKLSQKLGFVPEVDIEKFPDIRCYACGKSGHTANKRSPRRYSPGRDNRYRNDKKITSTILVIDLVQSVSITADYMTVKIH